MQTFDLTPTKQDIIIANQQRIIALFESIDIRLADIEAAIIAMTTEK